MKHVHFVPDGKLGGQAFKRLSLEKYYENPARCLECGAIIMVLENQKASEVRRKKFCNHSCAAKYNNPLKPKRKPRERMCGVCGVTFAPKQGESRNRCKEHSFRSIDRRRDWNSVTVEEIRKVRKHQKNSRIRDLAREDWKRAGGKKVCEICGYDKHIEICHIKAINSFSLDAKVGEVNSISNLVALCPNHHWEFDNGLLKLGH